MSDKKSLDQKIERIIAIAEPIAEPLGLIVVDAKFGQQGRRRTLELTIFKKVGWVSLSDCEQMSRMLESELDKRATSEGPFVDGAFDLLVQSPGIDRQLKSERDFKLFSGQAVQVQTKEKIGELGTHFKGSLVGSTDGQLHIKDAEAVVQKTKGKAVAPKATAQNISFDLKHLINVKLYSDDLKNKAHNTH